MSVRGTKLAYSVLFVFLEGIATILESSFWAFGDATEWTTDTNQLLELPDDGVISKSDTATSESVTCRIFESDFV